MSRLIPSILLAVTVMAGAAGLAYAAEARPREGDPVGAARRSYNAGSISWTDTSDPYGGYGPNSPEGNRAFWDYQGQHGN